MSVEEKLKRLELSDCHEQLSRNLAVLAREWTPDRG